MDMKLDELSEMRIFYEREKKRGDELETALEITTGALEGSQAVVKELESDRSTYIKKWTIALDRAEKAESDKVLIEAQLDRTQNNLGKQVEARDNEIKSLKGRVGEFNDRWDELNNRWEMAHKRADKAESDLIESERKLASSNQIREAEKRILIHEIEKIVKLKEALNLLIGGWVAVVNRVEKILDEIK